MRGVRLLGYAWAVALCGHAAAAPLAYPTTATPFVPTQLSASPASPGSSGTSTGLAQPTFLATGAAPTGSNDSVNVPGLSQPQFLITDHATPATSQTDWRAKPSDSTPDSDTTSSGWSLLWRQATGGNSKATNRSPSGATTASDQTTPYRTNTAQTQSQLGNDSVWTELAPTKRRNPEQKQPAQQPQQQESFDSLVNQMGLPAPNTAPSSTPQRPAAKIAQQASVQETPIREATRSRSAIPQSAQSTSNTATTPSTYSGLWSQVAGETGAEQNNNSNNAPDSGRPPSRSTSSYANRPSGVQAAAAWSSTDQSPQAAAPQSGGFWSSLGRPFTMQTNEAPIGRPAASQTASAPPAADPSSDDYDEAEHVPRLLQPFYQTQSAPPSGRRETPLATARSRHSGPDVEQVVRKSKLTQQLTMSSREDLHAKPGDAEAALRSDQEAWDSGWTKQSPSGLNPFSMNYDPDRPVNYASQATTVAYLQEAIPTPAEPVEPEKISLPGDENAEQGDQAASGDNGENAEGQAGEGKKKEDKLATADKLGTKPEDRSLEFLRTETVLLKPGKYQFDIGFLYSIQERNFPILFRTIDPTNPVDDGHFLSTDGQTVGLSVDEARFKSRELEVPMQLRYGLFKRVQAFIGAPVGWSNTEVDLNGRDEFKNDGGIGDISFGATIQLQDGQADCPYVIGTFVATAPSGGDPFTNAALFSPSAPSLGNGFWKLGGNLLMIQPLDPVTFFYGVGIRGSFEHDYIGATFEPGLEYNYTFGLGFAINEKVTLSTQLFGEYQSRLQVNGQGIDGSSQEPISLQFAATIARPCDRLVEPFINFGLTEDAVAATLGITWTY